MQSPGFTDWSDKNEAVHLEKHGIWFDFAAFVFLDADRLETPDLREFRDPPRFNTIGLVDGICINVTFAMEGDVAIIISARPASRRERERYAA